MKKEKRKVTSVSGTALAAGVGQNFEDRHRWLVLRQDKEFGLEVVDLAKDPLAAGPLARSTTRNSILDKALWPFRSRRPRNRGKPGGKE